MSNGDAWRRLICLLLAVTVAGLGGCSGAFTLEGGPSPGGETVTPAPVPTTGPTATPDRPVWIDSGHLDVDRLKRAHRNVLAGRSYTLVGRPTRTGAGASNRTYAVESAETYRTVSGNDTTYADPSGRYTREYRAFDDSYTVTAGPARRLDRRQLATLPFVYFGGNVSRITAIERDGERFYRLIFTDRRAPFDPKVVEYTATVYVTPGGFVRTVAFTGQLRRPAGHVRLGYRWSYRDVGNTTVERPHWVERARRNRTTPGPGTGT